jgi:hypothetical protein
VEPSPSDVAVARAPVRGPAKEEKPAAARVDAKARPDKPGQRVAKDAAKRGAAKKPEEKLELPKKLQDELRSLGYLDE